MRSRFGFKLVACLAVLSACCTSTSLAEEAQETSINQDRGSYRDAWMRVAAYPRRGRTPNSQATQRGERSQARAGNGAADRMLKRRFRQVSLEGLEGKIDQVLEIYRRRLLDVAKNDHWEVMHGIIAYGCDTKLARGRATDAVNAIAYVCWNGTCAGDQLLYTNRGRLEARKGPHVQGHYGQFLAILAQSRVNTDYPLLVDKKQFTIADLIESEKLGCRENTELTFKLIALTHYLGSDAQWKNDLGQDWSIERLIKAEIGSTIQGAACGGTHRLTAIYYPVERRLKEGKPITGQYLRAQKYTHDYQRYAFSLQNSDGSFSTEWFKRAGNRQDVDRKLKTSGHIFEWLVFTLPDEALRDQKMVKTANFLASVMLAEPKRQWEIGPLGHAIHALQLYRTRVYHTSPTPQADEQPPIAEATENSPQIARRKPTAVVSPESDEATNDESSATTTELPAENIEPVDTSDDAETSEELQEAIPEPAIEGPALFFPMTED